jgi:hypothetical protein
MELSIDFLGEEPPPASVFEKNLSPSQKAEIDSQKEKIRIFGLTHAERQSEMENLINGAASEALRLHEIAELKGEIFDKSTWFQAQRSEFVLRYTSGDA